MNDAVAGIRAEVARLLESGVTADEIDRARRYLIGTHAIGMQRKSALAAALAFAETYGQSWREVRQYDQQIARVSAADVMAAARRYLIPARQVTAVVRPKDDAAVAASAR